MAYQALYRTYRPQTFNKVVGQEAVVKTLQNAIINNKISHAYLFCGPRGTGKTSVARIFAKALNCIDLKPNGEPCCDCYVCKEISEGISPDVIEIDAASNNGVDEIRDIRERVKFLPSGSKYKIYIIDEVHMLSTGAFNALLKILEEPPKHVIFILATTEPQKIPSTIISRCQRYEFKPINVDKISKSLREVCNNENVQISDEAIDLIGEIADGGMRDALSILDQTISYGTKEITIDDVNTITGSINAEVMCNLMSFIDSKDANNALDVVNSLIKEGKEINKIVNGMLLFCRDLMLFKSIGNKKINKYIFEKEKFQNLAFKIANTKIIFFIEVLCDIQNKIKYSNSPGIYLEIAIIRMSSINNEELNVVKRMDELENKLMDASFSGDMVTSNVDNEKVKNLDNRLNQIVLELNKFELPTLAKKVNDIENTVNEHQNKLEAENKSSSSVRLTELESDVASKFVDIEAKINALENGQRIDIEGGSESSVNEERIQKEIADIKKQINELEKNSAKPSNNDSSLNVEEFQNKLNDIKQELISELQKKENKKENNYVDIDVNEIEAKIDFIQSKIDKLESEQNKNTSQDNNLLNDEFNKKLEELEEKINSIKPNEAIEYDTSAFDLKIETAKNEIKKEFASELSTFAQNKQEGSVNVQSEKENEEINKRLEKIEGQIYDLIASKLALEEKLKASKLEKQEKAKTQKRPKGQMSIFDFDISEEKDLKSDFGDLAKDEEEKESCVENIAEEPKDEPVIETKEDDSIQVVEEKKVENNDVEASLDEKQAVSDTEEKPVYKQTSFFDFNIDIEEIQKQDEKEKTESTEYKEPEIQEGLFDDSVSVKEEKPQEVVEDKNNNEDIEDKKNIDFKPIEKDKVINQFYDESNHEEVINKTRSSLVIKDVVENEPATVKQNEIIIPTDPEANDKFARYNIEDLEKLLFDAQDTNAKNDKARVLEIWKTLMRGVEPSMYSVAQSLSQGKIEAVGNKEFVITYPTVTKCNEVMRGAFKTKAIKFLYSKLSANYNYLALPLDVWLEKREEYVSQYQMGVKRAKLSPFNIVGLNVEEISEDGDKNKEKIEQTIKMFGDDIVKIK